MLMLAAFCLGRFLFGSFFVWVVFCLGRFLFGSFFVWIVFCLDRFLFGSFFCSGRSLGHSNVDLIRIAMCESKASRPAGELARFIRWRGLKWSQPLPELIQ
jgi:hypothetical protein